MMRGDVGFEAMNVRGKARKEINILVRKHYDEGYHIEEGGAFEYRLYACPKCNTLSRRFYAKFKHGEGETFETRCNCHKCRRELIGPVGKLNEFGFVEEPTEEEIARYNCSKCGQKTLIKGQEMICWD